MWVCIVWVGTGCIRYDKLAKQNISQVSHEKALPAGISREGLTCETFTKTSYHHLSWLFTFQSCAEHILHFAGRLLVRYPWKHLWSSMSLKSSHSLLHTTLTMKSHINTWYIRLNKITIKFGTELKPIQNSCKLQLYKVYLSTLDKPKVTINYI